MLPPRSAVALAVIALLGASACSVQEGKIRRIDQPPDPAEGREIFESACAPCHGRDARGNGPVAPSLTTPVPDLTLLAAEHGGTFPHREVIDVIRGVRPVAAHGTSEMPVWGNPIGDGFGGSRSGAAAAAMLYRQRRVEDVVAYLQTLQRSEAATGATP